ncbi:hypothetical protein [Microbispora triticiradicis]|uniref:hypothetical protein n=1 Tax=Microbispora triticiradicis TaxID=2200763 RepID=UPI001AD63B6F|nr:hypothetical protein [Microbispora triticiradicis]MBO4270864.1 hypothetical protein [Microbispora triticiradicis]
MRTRRLAAAALVAGGLAFGAVTGSATAAYAQTAEAWHLTGYYQYRDQCFRAGFQAITSGGIAQDFKCELAGSRYALYLYY